MVTLGHLRVTLGHLMVTLGHLWVTLGNIFSISNHTANTTELHPKVRSTCLKINCIWHRILWHRIAWYIAEEILYKVPYSSIPNIHGRKVCKSRSKYLICNQIMYRIQVVVEVEVAAHDRTKCGCKRSTIRVSSPPRLRRAHFRAEIMNIVILWIRHWGWECR